MDVEYETIVVVVTATGGAGTLTVEVAVTDDIFGNVVNVLTTVVIATDVNAVDAVVVVPSVEIWRGRSRSASGYKGFPSAAVARNKAHHHMAAAWPSWTVLCSKARE